jgi:hypothetical protein
MFSWEDTTTTVMASSLCMYDGTALCGDPHGEILEAHELPFAYCFFHFSKNEESEKASRTALLLFVYVSMYVCVCLCMLALSRYVVP